MADFNSSLPVRTQNNGDVVINVADGVTETQLLGVDSSGRVTVKLDDGSGNVITSQANGGQRALDVGIDVSGVQIDPRMVGQYNSTLPTLTSGSNTALQTNANGVLLAAYNPDANPATQAITVQDTASTSTAEYNQTWYSGTPTSGSAAAFALASQETVVVEVSGTWTGTLQFEVSVDGGTNWIAHSIHLLGSPIFTSSVTGNVMGSINVAGKSNFRVRATAAMTGSATVKVNESLNASSVYVANSIKLVDGSSTTSTTTMNIVPASTAASASNTSVVVGLSPNSPLPAGSNTIGSIASINNALPAGSNIIGKVEITDGTNVAGVAPASTAATSTQPAEVVALSPNSPVPTGTNIIGKIEITDGTNVGGVTAASTAASAAQSAQVVALSPNSPIPSGTNAIGSVLANMQVANAPVTVANPVPVTITTASAGTPIQSYQTSAALAAGSSVTLTYTVATGHTFSLERMWASASGKIKATLQNGATTIMVGFNSTANPNIDFTVTAPPTIASAGTVNVIITNEDKAAFDVYATIEGNQIT